MDSHRGRTRFLKMLQKAKMCRLQSFYESFGVSQGPSSIDSRYPMIQSEPSASQRSRSIRFERNDV
jgi:hypothetical protein